MLHTILSLQKFVQGTHHSFKAQVKPQISIITLAKTWYWLGVCHVYFICIG